MYIQCTSDITERELDQYHNVIRWCVHVQCHVHCIYTMYYIHVYVYMDLGTKLNNYCRYLFNFNSTFSVWTSGRVHFQHFSALQLKQFKLFLKKAFLAIQGSF